MLGALLAQFPISFKCTDENRAYVEQLVRKFRSYPLVLEIRHASWNEPEVLGWLQGLQVGLCNIDQPLLGRAVRPSAHATSVVGYIRLHGRNYKQWFAETNVRDRYDYLYSAEELAKWKDRAWKLPTKRKPLMSWPIITTWAKRRSMRSNLFPCSKAEKCRRPRRSFRTTRN